MLQKQYMFASRWAAAVEEWTSGSCFYAMGDGGSHPGINRGDGFPWNGAQSASQGGRIGMLLDFDQGCMTESRDDGGNGDAGCSRP